MRRVVFGFGITILLMILTDAATAQGFRSISPTKAYTNPGEYSRFKAESARLIREQKNQYARRRALERQRTNARRQEYARQQAKSSYRQPAYQQPANQQQGKPVNGGKYLQYWNVFGEPYYKENPSYNPNLKRPFRPSRGISN